MIGIFFAALLGAQCADVVVPEATEQAIRYYDSGNILWIVQQGWGLLLPLLFLITGFSGKIGSFSERWGKVWFFTIVVYLFLFVPLYNLLSFPLDFYSGYVRPHEYGFSSQSLDRWLDHYGKEIIVVLVGSLAFVWMFYLLLKKSPRRWWFYSAILSCFISFFLVFVKPIWVSPFFNHFGSMKNKELEAEILSLAKRAGISDGRVFEVDKSKDTKMINAYVTGFGSTNRIVLWDTAVKGLSKEQLLFVMGHEMGHYVLHHVWWQFIYLTILSFLIFYLTYKTAHYLLRRYHHRFGFIHLDSIASLPLLMLLIGFFSFLSMPLSNCISRYMEHEADRFGLEITQNNRAAGEAFVILQQENLGNPTPGNLYVIWRSSHPPLKQRVDFCNSYCPWKEGKPLKYGKYFKEGN